MTKLYPLPTESLDRLMRSKKILIVRVSSDNLKQEVFVVKKKEIRTWLEENYEDLLEEMFVSFDDIERGKVFDRIRKEENLEIYSI